MPRSREARDAFTTILLLLIAMAAVGLIGVSPIALGAFNGDTGRWERLSFIGQTYGAASAVVSVLALVGIVVTLSYQAREAKLSREEARRQAIGELLKMAMDDSDLDECWGPVPEPSDPKTRKQLLYTNMIVSEWAMSYETRALPEARLRANANEMFQGPVGRAYWQDARENRLSTSAGRRERRFHEILDEEYERTRGRDGQTPAIEISGAGKARESLLRAGAVATAVAVLLILRRWLQRFTDRAQRRRSTRVSRRRRC